MTPDPQTQNPYAYALNNPVNYSDPSGKFVPLAVMLALPAVATYLSMIPPQFLAYETDKIYNSLKDCDFAGAGLEALNILPMGGLVKGELSVVKTLNIVFKTEHGMRHFENTGLTSDVIEQAIKADIISKGAGAISKLKDVAVNVRGVDIIYRPYTLPDGTINVGTYFTK